MSNPNKYKNIHKLRFILDNIYEKVITLKVAIQAIKLRFTINCGCKFTLFANSFNIKKVKFVLSFCLHKKTCWYDKNLGILENTSSNHLIWREQKYRQHNTGKKTAIHATKRRFTLNCGCKFTLFAINFNIEKVNLFSLSVYIKKDMLIWQEFRNSWKYFLKENYNLKRTIIPSICW